MNPAEVTPMLDVHPPHAPMHGWRDFLLHLATITIGLLIALSLEGLVEWRHHRHLVHDAESSLHDEIKKNAAGMQNNLKKLHQQQDDLTHDIEVLKLIIAKGKLPKHEHMSVNFSINGFEDVSWTTSQATGALAYMPYADAKEYSDIYSTQTEVTTLEHSAARDAAIALSSFFRFGEKDPDPTEQQANAIIEKITVLQGQLLIVDSFMQGLAKNYDAFLKNHPDTE
jgi:hypothetical protein